MRQLPQKFRLSNLMPSCFRNRRFVLQAGKDRALRSVTQIEECDHGAGGDDEADEHRPDDASQLEAFKTPRVTMPKMENRALGEVAGPTLISDSLGTKRVIPFVATLLLVADFDHIGCRF